MSGTKASDVLNIPRNAIAPFKTGLLAMGSFEYIVMEVIVDMVVRMLVGSVVRGVSRKRIMDLVAVHTLSLPIMGGLAGGFNTYHDESATFVDHLGDGAKGILAVYTAQYVHGISCSGFYIPRPGALDAIVTAAAKTLSRPLNAMLAQYAPDQVKHAIKAVTEVIRTQQNQSLLKDARGYAKEKTGWSYLRR